MLKAAAFHDKVTYPHMCHGASVDYGRAIHDKKHREHRLQEPGNRLSFFRYYHDDRVEF